MVTRFLRFPVVAKRGARRSLLIGLTSLLSLATWADVDVVWSRFTLPSYGVCGVMQDAADRYVWVMDEGSLKKFDVRTGSCVALSQVASDLRLGDPVQDGELVLSWHAGKLVWLAADGRIVRSRVLPLDAPMIAASPVSRVAYLCNGASARAIDIDTGQTLYERQASSAAFSPDGQWVAAYGSTTAVLDARTGVVVADLGTGSYFLSWGRHHSGDLLLMKGRQVWRGRQGAFTKVHELEGTAHGVFSKDGRILYKLLPGGRLTAFDTETWAPIRQYLFWEVDRPTNGYNQLALADGGSKLVALSGTRGVVFDVVTGTTLHNLYEGSGRTMLERQGNVGSLVFLQQFDGVKDGVLLRDAQTGARRLFLRRPLSNREYSLVASETLIAEHDAPARSLTMMSSTTGDTVRSLNIGPMIRLFVSPDGTDYVPFYNGSDPGFEVRDSTLGTLKRRYDNPYYFVSSFEWSGDGSKLIGNPLNTGVFQFDWTTLSVLSYVYLPAGNRSIEGVSDDGRYALFSRYRELTLVDFQTQQKVVLKGSPGKAALAPNGKSYVIADSQGVRIGAVDGSMSFEVAMESSYGTTVKYSRDGRRIYVASSIGVAMCLTNPIQ